MTDKHMTTDQIDVVLVEGNSVTHTEMVDKITELYNRNMHKAYENFKVNIVKDAKIGYAVVFEGEREEDKAETATREAKEAASRKLIEDKELKEYLRLRKKYGKKDEQ